jgi:hypothetical protein
MLLVPDITAGTGTESDETPGWWWPVGLSQSEGAHEMAVPSMGLFSGCPAIWELADPRSTLRRQGGSIPLCPASVSNARYTTEWQASQFPVTLFALHGRTANSFSRGSYATPGAEMS